MKKPPYPLRHTVIRSRYKTNQPLNLDLDLDLDLNLPLSSTPKTKDKIKIKIKIEIKMKMRPTEGDWCKRKSAPKERLNTAQAARPGYEEETNMSSERAIHRFLGRSEAEA